MSRYYVQVRKDIAGRWIFCNCLMGLDASALCEQTDNAVSCFLHYPIAWRKCDSVGGSVPQQKGFQPPPSRSKDDVKQLDH
jgi:hypothetical protein